MMQHSGQRSPRNFDTTGPRMDPHSAESISDKLNALKYAFMGANVVSDLSLITKDIYTYYISNDRSSCALSYETIHQWIGRCLAKLPK